jgi:hypothetical protein
MDSPAVLKSPAYLAVKNNPSERTRRMLKSVTGFTRYIAEETASYPGQVDQAKALDAPFLYSVFSDTPPQYQDDFKDELLVRRFKILDGEPKPWTHLALRYLKDASAIESLQFPWPTERLVHHKHGSRQ